MYGLVSNLGSLVVRTLFTPLEEAAFASFSRSAATGAGRRGTGLAQLASTLALMTRGVIILGLLAVAFGPSYSYTLLRLLYSTRWSDTEAPFVMGCYTVYILFLAVNGALSQQQGMRVQGELACSLASLLGHCPCLDHSQQLLL